MARIIASPTSAVHLSHESDSAYEVEHATRP